MSSSSPSIVMRDERRGRSPPGSKDLVRVEKIDARIRFESTTTIRKERGKFESGDSIQKGYVMHQSKFVLFVIAALGAGGTAFLIAQPPAAQVPVVATVAHPDEEALR